MVSEGALPVVWCMRDNQLVPHQVSGVKLQGAVTGAHIAAVTDFLRMVAGTQIILPPTAVSESIDNDINKEKENTTRRRKMSMQVEVPCVFLSESALQKAKSRNNSLEEKVILENSSLSMTKSTESDSQFCISKNKNPKYEERPGIEKDTYPQRITRIIELDDFDSENMNETEKEPLQRITRIIEFENDKFPAPVTIEEDNEMPQKITRIIEFNEDNSVSTHTNSNENTEEESLSQKSTRLIESSKENSFPSMAKIIEMENERSNERRISLISERDIGCGIAESFSPNIAAKTKPIQRGRFSVDSSCSDNSYANIESINSALKSLQDGRKEDATDFVTNEAFSSCKPMVRSRFRRKKTSVCSIGSSDCDDEIDVIFKSKPKSSQWVSLDWIPPPPKEEPVITQVCDKNDFITKWIAEQNSHDSGIVHEERRRSLPPKSNEIYLQNMRRFSDGLQICKEDAASDSPATVKWKWHDIVKRHIQLLKNDKGFRRQRGSWIRTARRLSGANENDFTEPLPLDTYMKLNSMP